jgi:dihydropteroate synthase
MKQALLERLADSDQPPLVMGILNRTPDSFSDGGSFYDPANPRDTRAAMLEAERMIAAGAELLDVGGESTRPGAQAVSQKEELARVMPLIRELCRLGLPVSIDTRSAQVAQEALAAGAVMVNDISAANHDPAMPALLAESGALCILMHMQGQPATMQQAPCYGNVVDEVLAWLLEQAARLIERGLPAGHILLDPGIGFGKRLLDNGELFAQFAGRAASHGHALVMGASRKSFIALLEEEQGRPASTQAERLGGSLAAALVSARQGYRLLRVHDVAQTVQALRVWKWIEACR